MMHTGKLRAERMRAPVPLLALLAAMVALLGFSINFGEVIVSRFGPVQHHHARRGIGDDDHGRQPGGLSVASQGYVLRPRTTRFTAGEFENYRFTVFTDSGQPVTDFVKRAERRMNLVVVRRDLSGYQHLYPTMDSEGTWTVPLQLNKPGSYRVFAEFLPGSATTPVTLGVDLEAAGMVEPGPISKVSKIVDVDGYTVIRTGELLAGSVSRVGMHVMRGTLPVTDLDPFLGEAGRLVILREGDLAYLHVRPVPGPRQDTAIDFDVDVPSSGYYRMFLEFQHHGQVRTVEFTALTR